MDSNDGTAAELRDRCVLVTGGAGYIGAHTTIALLEAGCRVVVLDNLANGTVSAVHRAATITGKDVELVVADIRDSNSLDRVFSEHPIDSVIHFAGSKAVAESVADPLNYYDNNVCGTLSILRAMSRHEVFDFVFSSSCTVYGDPISVPLVEDSPLVPKSPYGRTKLIVEGVLEDLSASSSSWRTIALRYFNPVGAHPSGQLGEDPVGVPQNLLPYTMGVATGRFSEIQVFGTDYPTRDGTCIRDYIHVMDLAEGHVAALQALESASTPLALNLGTGLGTTVLEVLETAGAAVGVKIPWRPAERRAGDVVATWADPTAATRVLNWRATRGLNQMCQDAWRWHRAFPQGLRGLEEKTETSVHPYDSTPSE